MLLVKTLFTVSAYFFLFYYSGLIFSKFFKIKNFSYSIFFSISLIFLIVSLLYFKLDLQFYIIRIIVIILTIILSLLSLTFLNKKIIKKIFLDYFIFIPSIIFFSFLIQIYDLQYYIFRGNYYDVMNYTSMSLAFSSYSFSELNEIFRQQSFDEDNIYLVKAGILNGHRVIAPLFFSINYLPNFIDVFHANSINKLFFLGISSIAIKIFLEELMLIDKKNIILISAIFPFSFWAIYIFEIDAFSQLMALPFSILALCIIFSMSVNFIRISIKEICFYIFIISSFFCIYPEQGSIYGLLGLIFFLINNYKNINKFHFNKKFLVSLILVFLVIMSHENIFSFLKFQLKDFSLTHFSWWGYFGAFLLGSENIVLNETFVSELKEFIKSNDFNLSKIIFKIHNSLILNNYDFYYLNIIPSIFGLYYLSLGKIVSNLDYLKVLLILGLNYLLIKITLKNFIIIFKKHKITQIKFIKFTIIYFLIFSSILLIKFALWQIIKLYMYFSIFFFLLVVINYTTNFKKNRINKLILIFLIIFPIYKFSEFNHGISRNDSFPSIVNKTVKIKIDWVTKKNQLISCEYSSLDNDLDDKIQNKASEELDFELESIERGSVYYIYSIIRSYEKLKYIRSENPCNKN